MKLVKLLPLLLLGLVFIKQDIAACAEHDLKKEDREKKARVIARSAHKAVKETTAPQVDLHPDFMIGNSMLRF